ncbi:MAG: hypothetical protein AAFR79_02080, partial [Pseudomonadota bacterium]
MTEVDLAPEVHSPAPGTPQTNHKAWSAGLTGSLTTLAMLYLSRLTDLVPEPALAEAQSRFDAEIAAILQDGLIVTADAFILPGYVALSDASTRMEMATEAYCSGSGSIEAAQEGFAET